MQNPLRIYRSLPTTIHVLFWVQVINRCGDFVIPFLALFLVAKMGLDPKTAGMIATIAIILQAPGSLIGGRIADHYGRKITYLVSQTVAGLCIMLCAFVPGKMIIGLLFISTFCGAAVKPTLNTMVYDRLRPEERKAGYSLMYLGINLGMAVGPLVAGFLFNHFLKLFFIGDALTSFLAVSLVSVKVKDGETLRLERGEDCRNQAGLVADLVKKPQIAIFLAFSLILSFVYVQGSFSLPLMLKTLFRQKGPVYMGYVMSINAVTVLTLTTLITAITQKIPFLINIAVAGVFYGIGFGMVGLSNYLPFFLVSTILWTIGEILDATNSGIFIANNCRENIRARYSALMMITGSTGKALGTLAMGGYIQKMGVATVWPLIMAIAFGTAFLIYLLHVHLSRNKTDIKTRLDELA